MAAVVALKSLHITNSTTVPRVNTPGSIGGGNVKSACGLVTPNTDDSVASTYRFCRIPSNCRVKRVFVTAADFTTAGVIDIGLYRISEDGGAVVDADLFASLVDMAASTGVGTNTDLMLESTTFTGALREKQLWDVLGLTADPGVMYDVVATVTTAFNGGQAMFVEVDYVT